MRILLGCLVAPGIGPSVHGRDAGFVHPGAGVNAVRERAEITTEANPDSVDAAALVALREGGINRISFGMQSAVRPVLATLDPRIRLQSGRRQ